MQSTGRGLKPVAEAGDDCCRRRGLRVAVSVSIACNCSCDGCPWREAASGGGGVAEIAAGHRSLLKRTKWLEGSSEQQHDRVRFPTEANVRSSFSWEIVMPRGREADARRVTRANFADPPNQAPGSS